MHYSDAVHHSAWVSIWRHCLFISVAVRACLQEAMPKDPTSIQSLGCAHKEGYHKVCNAYIYPNLCCVCQCSFELL